MSFVILGLVKSTTTNKRKSMTSLFTDNKEYGVVIIFLKKKHFIGLFYILHTYFVVTTKDIPVKLQV